MSSGIEGIGEKFLLKLYEKTVNNGTKPIDKREIGKELWLIYEQTDNLVNKLASYGYLKKEGRKKAEV